MNELENKPAIIYCFSLYRLYLSLLLFYAFYIYVYFDKCWYKKNSYWIC